MSNHPDSTSREPLARLTGQPPFKTGKVPLGFGNRKKSQMERQPNTWTNDSRTSQPNQTTPKGASGGSKKPHNLSLKDAHTEQRGGTTNDSRINQQEPATEKRVFSAPTKLLVSRTKGTQTRQEGATTDISSGVQSSSIPPPSTPDSVEEATTPPTFSNPAVPNDSMDNSRDDKAPNNTPEIAEQGYIGVPQDKMYMMAKTSGLFAGSTSRPEIFNNLCESQGRPAQLSDFVMESDSKVANRNTNSAANGRVQTPRGRPMLKTPVESPRNLQQPDQRPRLQTPDLQTPDRYSVDFQTPDRDSVDFQTPDRDSVDRQTRDRKTETGNQIISRPILTIHLFSVEKKHFMSAFAVFSQKFGRARETGSNNSSPTRSRSRSKDRPLEGRDSRSSSVQYIPPSSASPAPTTSAQLPNQESTVGAPTGSNTPSAQPSTSKIRATREDSVQLIPPPSASPAQAASAELANQESSRGAQAASGALAGSDISPAQPAPSKVRATREDSVQWIPPSPVGPTPSVSTPLANHESSRRARGVSRAPDSSSAQRSPSPSGVRAIRARSVRCTPARVVAPSPSASRPVSTPPNTLSAQGSHSPLEVRAGRTRSGQMIPIPSVTSASLSPSNHSIVAQSEFSLRPRNTVANLSSDPSTTVRISPPATRKRTLTTTQDNQDSSQCSSSSAPPKKRLVPAWARQRVEEKEVVQYRPPQRHEVGLLTVSFFSLAFKNLSSFLQKTQVLRIARSIKDASKGENNSLWLENVKKNLNRVIQEGKLLARKQDYIVQAISQILCEKNLTVVALADKECQVGNGKKTYHAVQLESVSNGEMKGKCLCPYRRQITMDIDQVVCDPTLLESIRPTLHLENLQNSFYEVTHWQQAKANFTQGLWRLMEIGQHFELQLEECPEFVAVVRVVANHYGLLVVAVGNRDLRTVHVTNPYCHEMGWALAQRDLPMGQHVQYVPGLDKMLENDAEVVPSVVFRDNAIHTHRVSENDVVAYLDSEQNAFYYAHIITRVPEDDHFFHLQVGKREVVNPRPVHVFDVEEFYKEAIDGMLLASFHIYHRRIFPIDLVLEFGAEIHLPEDGDRERAERVLGTPCSSDAAAYIQLYTRGEGHCLGQNVGANHDHILTARALGPRKMADIKAKMSTLRFVEILREKSDGTMKLKGAQVVKASRNMLCLKVAHEEKLVYTHIADPNIFRYGTCDEMGILIEWERAIIMRDIKEEVEDDYPN
ncbi:CRE-SOR-3 protein [Caenorhabditis remanei]|uniref:CRE-SOR-3 protein n=1 Tax=Caenorhabditis remanei TaxID=31234 RepID=E3MAF3_CAERE|nr:CRE-SOR-3 protein [Caenorhabditis remanei]